MRQPKGDLTAILQKSNGDIPTPETEAIQPPPEVSKSQRCPSREGKKVIQGHFPKAVHVQVKLLCIEKELTVQEILAEALDAYFTMNDKPAIASKSTLD